MRTSGIRALLRTALLLGGAVLTLSAAPSAAAYSVLTLSGNYGHMTFSDGPGAKCIYGSDGHLDRVSVRGASLLARDATFGQDEQWVGYSFKVQRFDHDPADPFEQHAYTTIYTSPVVKKIATDAQPAVFDRRAWTAPQSLEREVRVVVTGTWYKHGSKTQVDGTIKLGVEYYRATRGAAEKLFYWRCTASY